MLSCIVQIHPGNSDWCVGIEWLVVFCLCQGLPLMDWGHSLGGRVDDEAASANGEGENFRK